MKRIIAVILCMALVLSGCSSKSSKSGDSKKNKVSASTEENIKESENDSSKTKAEEQKAEELPDFSGLDDQKLLTYVEDNVYQELIKDLDSDDYFIENVEATYVSKEYLEELSYNSQENIFFGYTLEELDEQFDGERYMFTLGDNGETVVKKLDSFYDDSFERTVNNVAIGGGVILVCVTVSAVSAGVGIPAVSMIFAASAKTGTVFALSSAAFSGTAAALVRGYQTQDIEEAIKAGQLAGSEGFKMGAISGALSGGGKEIFALKGATLNGLTMNQAAAIQMESKWPLDAIKSLHSTAEYDIYKKATLTPLQLSDGSWAFVRQIDWTLVDEFGRSNTQRVMAGLAPIDATGKSYELHHIGMKADSPLAILTHAEHHAKENYSILHWQKEGKNVSDKVFNEQKKEFWKAILKMAQGEM